MPSEFYLNHSKTCAFTRHNRQLFGMEKENFPFGKKCDVSDSGFHEKIIK